MIVVSLLSNSNLCVLGGGLEGGGGGGGGAGTYFHSNMILIMKSAAITSVIVINGYVNACVGASRIRGALLALPHTSTANWVEGPTQYFTCLNKVTLWLEVPIEWKRSSVRYLDSHYDMFDYKMPKRLSFDDPNRHGWALTFIWWDGFHKLCD